MPLNFAHWQPIVAGMSERMKSLFDAFLYGLAEPIKDQLINRKLPEDVDSLIALVVKIDKRLQDRVKSRPDYSAPFQRGKSTTTQQSWRAPARFTPAAIAPAPSAGTEEPMQLALFHGSPNITPT